jgi:hypothetical protein
MCVVVGVCTESEDGRKRGRKAWVGGISYMHALVHKDSLTHPSTHTHTHTHTGTHIPVSIIRRHKGIISVCNKNEITSESSILTKAPMTPREVRRKYSKGRDFDMTVLRKG